MAFQPTELIAEQTGAVTVAVPFQVQQVFLPATLMATNLAGAETVEIMFSVDGGTTFEELAQDGADLTLTATANTLAITSPLLLGVKKDATVAAAGVFVMANQPAGAA